MSVPKIKIYENGAVVVYQKDPTFNGESVVIGFAGGCQFDGELPGLAHLLEHLIFGDNTIQKQQKKLSKVNDRTFVTNGSTSEHAIAFEFDATHENFPQAVELFVKSLKRRNFTEEEIKKEVEIVKQEMLYIKSGRKQNNSAFQQLLNTLGVDNSLQLNPIGTARALNKVTPKDLTKYMQKYFVSNNLIVSVTSNRPFEEVEKVLLEKVLDKFPEAGSEEQLSLAYIPDQINALNLLVAVPNKNMPNVKIDVLLTNSHTTADARTPDDIAKFALEKYVMNNSEIGLLWNKFRIENQLVYIYGHDRLDIGLNIFKYYIFMTNKSKINKTIKAFCELVKDLGNNGISESYFNQMKKSFVDLNSCDKSPDSCNAYNNFIYSILGKVHISKESVNKAINRLTYKEFNDYIKSTYSEGNISLAIEGDFDSKKIYNIIQIEEMIGNFEHSDNKEELNVPRVEYVPMVDKNHKTSKSKKQPQEQELSQDYFDEDDDFEM